MKHKTTKRISIIVAFLLLASPCFFCIYFLHFNEANISYISPNITPPDSTWEKQTSWIEQDGIVISGRYRNYYLKQYEATLSDASCEWSCIIQHFDNYFLSEGWIREKKDLCFSFLEQRRFLRYIGPNDNQPYELSVGEKIGYISYGQDTLSVSDRINDSVCIAVWNSSLDTQDNYTIVMLTVRPSFMTQLQKRIWWD